MNSVERNDWLSAMADCCPDLRWKALSETLERLDGLASDGSWEGAACSRAGCDTLTLRLWGSKGDYGDWARGARQALGLGADEKAPRAPAPGFPWLSLAWDGSCDQLRETSFIRSVPSRGSRHALATLERAGRKPEAVLLRPAPFASYSLGEPELEKAFAAFDRLCPIRDMVAEFSLGASGKPHPRPSWSLRLKEPMPWPLFLRLDMAKAFTEQASQLSFFLLDRGVGELWFDEKDTLIYFGR